MMRIVLDTNVLVSALLSPFGPPGRILDLVLAGELLTVCDDRLLAEYREVVGRPRFNFDPVEVKLLLAFLESISLHVATTPLVEPLPDPDEGMFLEVAIAGNATVVTGNLRHFPVEQRGEVAVLSPGDFLDRWRQEQSE